MKTGYTGVRCLSSGWWSVWINGDWIDAASLTREAAEKKLDEYIEDMQRGRE